MTATHPIERTTDVSYNITIQGDAPDADTEAALILSLTDALAANPNAGLSSASAQTTYSGFVDLLPMVTPPPPPAGPTVDAAYNTLGADLVSAFGSPADDGSVTLTGDQVAQIKVDTDALGAAIDAGEVTAGVVPDDGTDAVAPFSL